MLPSFLPALQDFWCSGGFDPAGRSFVVAVSGGVDSVALLELFSREVAPRANANLFAVHVNHGLRPEAARDQAFVEALCAARGVPLHVEVLDPASRASGESMEMWARARRYEAFARAAARFGADGVLTAHQRDDAVETVFLRLWRGTGFAGLAGVPFRRAAGALEIVRPLLPVPREALRAWLRSLDLSWREDASNADARIARNWLRHHFLPALRAREPDLDARVFALSRAVAAALPAWERWMAEEHPVDTVSERGGVPTAWLRDGMEPEALKRCLATLGVASPAPELVSELLRQAASATRIQARVDESSVLREKRGILVRSPSVFRRAARA